MSTEQRWFGCPIHYIFLFGFFTAARVLAVLVMSAFARWQLRPFVGLEGLPRAAVESRVGTPQSSFRSSGELTAYLDDNAIDCTVSVGPLPKWSASWRRLPLVRPAVEPGGRLDRHDVMFGMSVVLVRFDATDRAIGAYRCNP